MVRMTVLTRTGLGYFAIVLEQEATTGYSTPSVDGTQRVVHISHD